MNLPHWFHITGVFLGMFIMLAGGKYGRLATYIAGLFIFGMACFSI